MRLDSKSAVKLTAVFLLGLAFLTPVSAEENRAGSVVTLENETGDVNVFGGTTRVTGPIHGNLSVFSGDLSIDSSVSEDVRAFTGNTRINGVIEGTLTVFTGNLVLDEGSSVNGDLEANAGSVILRGEVNGDSTINAETISIESGAEIEGDLNYSAGNFTNEGTVNGEIIEREEDFNEGFDFEPFNLPTLGTVFSFLSRLAIGAVLLLALPGFTEKVVNSFREETLRSTLFGLSMLFIVPMILFLVFVTVIGIPLAVIGLVLYIIAVWIVTIYGSYALGTVPFEENKWAALITGLALWEILGLLSILGWFVQFVILVIGLGALTIPLWEKYS